MLLIAGAMLALAGLALLVADRLGLTLGRLPGDIRIERDGFHLYLPLGSCLLVSAVLSGVVWLIQRLR
jgi:hypothetical protein